MTVEHRELDDLVEDVGTVMRAALEPLRRRIAALETELGIEPPAMPDPDDQARNAVEGAPHA